MYVLDFSAISFVPFYIKQLFSLHAYPGLLYSFSQFNGYFHLNNQFYVFIIFILPISRVMMARSNIDESRYNREQKLFANMIEKMILASKDGMFNDFLLFTIPN